MKTYILSLLLIVFSFIVIHDFVLTAKDHDTQSELILKASGEIDIEQMCQTSQLHDILHQMLVASDVMLHKPLCTFDGIAQIQSFHDQLHTLFSPQSPYRPPIV